jgi:general secretion pathway protein A
MSQLLAHYGLSSNPFDRSTPKEALCRHRGFEEALVRIQFTLELGAFALLLAEAGCGKSVLLGVLADELVRLGRAVHYLAHSSIGPFGLVNVLARKVGISPRRSRGETALALTESLLQDDRHHVLVLDEAQALPDASLDDLRLLTIANFDRQSPFLLLLAGLPTLDDRLAEPTHYSLDQRITTVARLSPLSMDETREYLRTRLTAAGAGDRPVFEEGAIDAIFDGAGGVPRRINNLATSAMIVAAARRRRLVTSQDVHDAHLDRGRP